MDIHEVECFQEFLKTGSEKAKRKGVEKRIQAMKLNNNDPELIQQALRCAENHLVLRAFDIHLQNQIANVVPKILIISGGKGKVGIPIHQPYKLLVEGKLRP